MMLADMGADVTKIETFPEGDGSRRFEPKVNDERYCFAVLNRNKKSVALDMKQPQGKEIFMKLAASTDIIVENFRPGVTKKLGIDYEAIKKLTPAYLCVDLRLWPDRPLRKERRLRHHRAGHVGIMR